MTMKSVGRVLKTLPHPELVTEQAGVGVAVGVLVGVYVAVAVDVGVGLSHTVNTESILQPSPALPRSLPIRHLRMTVCPCGKPTDVLIKPPELPVQA